MKSLPMTLVALLMAGAVASAGQPERNSGLGFRLVSAPWSHDIADRQADPSEAE